MSTEVQTEEKKTANCAGRSEQAGRSWRRWYRFPRSWKEVKSLGWKFVLGFVLFYLIRDGILYILIPYLLYEGIIAL